MAAGILDKGYTSYAPMCQEDLEKKKKIKKESSFPRLFNISRKYFPVVSDQVIYLAKAGYTHGNSTKNILFCIDITSMIYVFQHNSASSLEN